MALKLINKKEIHTLEIEGTVIKYKNLDNGQKIIVGSLMAGLKEDGDGWNDCIKIISEVVVSIDGFEDESAYAVLSSIESAKTQSKIIKLIMKETGLSDEEAKNSPSSSDSKLTE